MIRQLCALCLSLLASSLIPVAARADDNRPLSVTLEEASENEWEASWKLPANLPARFVPELAPPRGCTAASPRRWDDALGFWAAVRWQCEQPLAGRGVAISYPPGAPPLATILRLRHADGSEATLLGQPGESVVTIPEVADDENLFLKFLRLGVEHIWLGFDHLLFVAGLIFIAGNWQRILATISGFTIAHSITLALSALDLVRLPIRAVEAVIALSIVFLAVEIAKGRRDTLTWRYPVLTASSFGLLHGFGFAAVLREIGLPEGNFLIALLGFNLGIEIGQVIFAGAAIIAFGSIRSAAYRLWRPGGTMVVQPVAAYGVGILATYWMFARLLA